MRSLAFCNLSCCTCKNTIPSLHVGRHATSWAHCSHSPFATYFNLILSFYISLGRTGVISPHQIVNIEPVNAFKQLTTLPGLLIISQNYYHSSNSQWFCQFPRKMHVYCKPSFSLFLLTPPSFSLYLALFVFCLPFVIGFRAHAKENQPSDHVIYFSHAHFCFNNYHIDSECIILQE